MSKKLYQDLEVKGGFSEGRENPKLKITIRYESLESTCEGPADEVLKFVFRFIRDVYPNYEIVSGLTLTVDLENLLRRLKGIMAFISKGRAVILKPTKELKDSDLILTHLVSAYVGDKIGTAENDHLSMADLLDKTGKPAGTVAGRLSELRSRLCVERVGRGEYRVTAYGVKEFMEEVLPKLERAE